MAPRNLALAQLPQAQGKKRRSRGRKRHSTGECGRGPDPAFDDLEQAFFAAAPPDEAAPEATPDCFDDLVGTEPEARDPLAGLRRALAAARVAVKRLFAPADPQRTRR
jgi:hypothetical protein